MPFLRAEDQMVVKRDIGGTHGKDTLLTPLRGACVTSRQYWGYHFAGASFNPRLLYLNPSGSLEP
jgi:hypothetical protein